MWTELHRHLDVSTRLSTLLELAQARGLEAQSTSLDAFRDKIVLRRPMKDLREVLAQFQLFQKILDRPEVLERVAFETVEDCRAEGTNAVELRFAPAFVTEFSSLSWDDVLSAFERGIARARAKYPEMRAGLICIAVRDFGVEGVDEAVEFFLKHKQRFIGLDLAGNEASQPCRLFEASFKKAARAGAKITVHAGEGAGPENMWEAIELLGARRIGHGVACVRDPKLMNHLASHTICLEICPTSNWLTQAMDGPIEAHPLPKILRAGIPATINTDDPGIFGITMTYEVDLCRKKLGLSEDEIGACFRNAAHHSFL